MIATYGPDAWMRAGIKEEKRGDGRGFFRSLSLLRKKSKERRKKEENQTHPSYLRQTQLLNPLLKVAQPGRNWEPYNPPTPGNAFPKGPESRARRCAAVREQVLPYPPTFLPFSLHPTGLADQTKLHQSILQLSNLQTSRDRMVFLTGCAVFMLCYVMPCHVCAIPCQDMPYHALPTLALIN